jgi:hypothetical protein
MPEKLFNLKVKTDSGVNPEEIRLKIICTVEGIHLIFEGRF